MLLLTLYLICMTVKTLVVWDRMTPEQRSRLPCPA